MTEEERIRHLEAENGELREQVSQLLVHVAGYEALQDHVRQLQDRVAELEGQLAKDSHNSSKPPSSDGLRHKRRSQRKPSGKKSGGQPGHEGHHLQRVEMPDEIVRHRPSQCQHCQQSLEGVAGQVVERRQVQDLPPLRLVVSEHEVEEICCPHCQRLTRGSFPVEVKAAVQYGPQVQALAVYLHQYHLVPLARTAEVLKGLCGSEVSEGTITRWGQQAAQVLTPTVARIASLLIAGRLQHGDETGVRIGGKGHWLHVNSTRWLTHLAWHPKRGRKALEAIGIWPQFRGRSMRDRFASYDTYACAHSVCGAHLLRDLTYLVEQEQQAWAGEMKDLLLSMHQATHEWRERGAKSVPVPEREQWQAQYFDLLLSGFAAQPPAPAEPVPKGRGRRKQSAAKNLLDDLLRRADQVLAFLDDLRNPFTNNQAERDLRMAKVQQKVAGTFRSEEGATVFCHIRSYLSTMRKQGRPLLEALAALFDGHPLPIAWGSE